LAASSRDNAPVPLRSYVYISKTKVNSLYEQIPPKQLKRLAKKLTIDLKVIKAELGAEEREDSLVARTQIVERFLDREGVVAEVDAAGEDDEIEFFRGRLPLVWEPGRYGGLIYFCGRTEATLLVLGGSGLHLTSNVAEYGIDATPQFFTSTPDLIEGLKLHYFGGDDGPPTADTAPGAPAGLAVLPPSSVAELVATTYTQAVRRGPETKMGFLAVPLASAALPPASSQAARDEPLLRGAAHALLASPLYVSLKH
jgi:hypothetical protein